MGEMKCMMTAGRKIMPSMCDSGSKLSIPALQDLFQDMASVHAGSLGMGADEMDRRNCFWVISKVRLHINRMPALMDDITVNTWIQPADRASCERDFSVTDGDEVLAYGRSIWAVISRDTGRLVHLDEFYPVVDFELPPPDDRPFGRPGRKFEDAEETGSYTIRSVDIDLGGHMNNVSYVRALLGCFSTGELAEMDIKELEMNYIAQSYEGKTLRFVRRDEPEGPVFGAINEDGKAAFTVRIS